MDGNIYLLTKACMDMVRMGLCRMDCDSGDWCEEVAERVGAEEGDN